LVSCVKHIPAGWSAPLTADITNPGTSQVLPIAVLCDFDGTISARDTVMALYARFGNDHCRDLNRKWVLGEISSQQEMEGCLGSSTATRAEIENALDTVPIDPSFPAFLCWCSAHGYPFAIVSDGIEYAIRHVLGRYGVHGLKVFANRMLFEHDGIRFESPWFHPTVPLRGVSKLHIIRDYQAQGYRIVFIGDGLSDLEALGAADFVFAKGKLLSLARERDQQALAFDSFAHVAAQWPEALRLLSTMVSNRP